MNISRIIKEDFISNFFRGLFTGKPHTKENLPKRLKDHENKFRKSVKKDVDDLNKSFALMYKGINKLRKENGDKPKKAPKFKVNDIVKQAKQGKYN